MQHPLIAQLIHEAYLDSNNPNYMPILIKELDDALQPFGRFETLPGVNNYCEIVKKTRDALSAPGLTLNDVSRQLTQLSEDTISVAATYSFVERLRPAIAFNQMLCLMYNFLILPRLNLISYVIAAQETGALASDLNQMAEHFKHAVQQFVSKISGLFSNDPQTNHLASIVITGGNATPFLRAMLDLISVVDTVDQLPEYNGLLDALHSEQEAKNPPLKIQGYDYSVKDCRRMLSDIISSLSATQKQTMLIPKMAAQALQQTFMPIETLFNTYHDNLKISGPPGMQP